MADIFRVADKFRRQMLRRERAAATEMVQYYGAIWKRIRAQIIALTKQYYEAEAPGTAWLYQLERLQTLQRQVEAEVRAFARFADTRIQTEQWEAVQAAQRHTQELTRIALGPAAERLGFGTELATQFNRLPAEAVSDLIGFLEDGSPLRELLEELGPSASKAVGQELVSGVGLGLSPREVASRVRKEFGGDLVRALRVARTETMRAYRETTRRSYEANGDIVGKWVWHAGLDNRTCAACWAMHGTVHPITERLDDHPNGRCAMVPLTKSWKEIGEQYGVDLSDVPETRIEIERGTELFGRLSPEDQVKILGPAKFAAYQNGEISLMDLVGRAQSRKWGSHRFEKSLKAVLG